MSSWPRTRFLRRARGPRLADALTSVLTRREFEVLSLVATGWIRPTSPNGFSSPRVVRLPGDACVRELPRRGRAAVPLLSLVRCVAAVEDRGALRRPSARRAGSGEGSPRVALARRNRGPPRLLQLWSEAGRTPRAEAAVSLTRRRPSGWRASSRRPPACQSVLPQEQPEGARVPRCRPGGEAAGRERSTTKDAAAG